MTKYTVTIRRKITREYIVEAVDEDAAMEQANEMFNISEDSMPGNYEQFVLNIVEEK